MEEMKLDAVSIILGRYQSEDLDVDRRIILKWILENMFGECGLNLAQYRSQ
jgi:hypothetical protein